MRVWKKALLLAAFVVVAAVVGQAALADSPGVGLQTDGARVGGIVPSLSKAPSTPQSGGGQLLYHGGPTMKTNVVYAIFWKPAGQTMSSSYIALIKQYLKDVALDSGKTTNVYFSDTQYSSILYSSKFGGAIVDKNAFPTSGCVDPLTPLVCLTDAQLRAEINKEIAVKGWTKSPTHAFFIFTPKSVGSCFGTSPSSGCAYTDYCAYHGAEGASPMMIYANQPYAAHPNCDVGQHPNGNDADATINVVSHEHNEFITDPDVSTGWYDNQGFENGDKCAWQFGPTQGPNGAEYNQVINTHHYWMQMEWSNATTRCVQQGT